MNHSNDDYKLNRRELIGTTVVASSAAFAVANAATESGQLGPPLFLSDTNVSLFKWPFRRLPLDETESLDSRLTELRITTALAGSFEGILHRDLSSVNEHLVAECEKYSRFVPIGTINPAAVGWEADFRRCIEKYKMPGIRLYPNYHQYNLEHPEFLKLLDLAFENKLLVQLAVAMEDTRTQHELVNVPDVDLISLPKIMSREKTPKVQLLNARLRTAQLAEFAPLDNLYFDTSRIDGTDGLSAFLQHIPAHRVWYGSHAPFLIPEASLIRIHESNLNLEQQTQLLGADSSIFIEVH